jgi:Flp pilus assembly protein TadD
MNAEMGVRKMASDVMNAFELKKVEVAEPPRGAHTPATPLLDQALALIANDDFASARVLLEAANRVDPEDPRVLSNLGLCIAYTERRFERAVWLCNTAAKSEFFNPEHYLNLARVHFAFGFRADGRRYLLRGQMIDPGNQAITRALKELGARNEPVLRFLPRGHLLNRWLGSARHVFVLPGVAA